MEEVSDEEELELLDSESDTQQQSDHEQAGQENSSSSLESSLLSTLHCPTASELARKRKVNKPPTGQKRSKGRTVGDPKSVSPNQRVREYPNESLKVSSNSLFCDACREPLCLKKSVIELHIKSVKHTKGKTRLLSKEIRERSICDMLKQYDSKVHPVGENLPTPVRVFQVKTVTAFLKSGVALNKLDCFRELLEETGFAMSSSQHLRELIPLILEEERSKIRESIKNREISIIYDGTTHIAEALAVLIRYVDDEWKIHQCVVRLMLLAKSPTGEEVARQLISTLSTELGIPSNLIIAATRDRASVNNVALRTLSIVYPQIIDVRCFSHTLGHVGEHFTTSVLNEFVSGWIGLFSRSPRTKLLWKTATGLRAPSYSTTRWWSKWEVIKQMHEGFADVESFITTADLPPASKSKIQHICDDPLKKIKLQIELAITDDAGEAFVRATYYLEGDGPLIFTCYNKIQELKAGITTAYYPSTNAVIKKIASGNESVEKQLIDYAKACAQPAYDYFHCKFDVDLKETLLVFKASRYFDPLQLIELQPTCCDIDELRVLKFLNSKTIDGLKSELPVYMSKAADLSSNICKLTWWKRHAVELPCWSNACKSLLLIQPSSAAAERVFSLLNNSFNDQQNSCLEDYIECSIMLQYNYMLQYNS